MIDAATVPACVSEADEAIFTHKAAATVMGTRDIITVVRDPRNVLGKQFSFAEDGTIRKTSKVYIAIGEAVQHHVPDIAALEILLATVSEDSHAAISNSAFPLIPVGVPFLIFSEAEFANRGVKRSDPSVTWPVTVQYDGKDWLALGRFKEHTAPSSWQLLDRDVDAHTPQHFADLDYAEWLAQVDRLLPGVVRCARLRAHSSSARISYRGQAVGGGNGHTWIQVADPDDIPRMRTAIKARALDLGMAWAKPRHSRTTGEVVGRGLASIIDWTVFGSGRLVFAGKPEVHDAL